MTGDPTTVTFGATAKDEPWYRSSRRGEGWLWLFLGLPTMALALVAVGLSTVLAISLVSGWWETIVMVITADALAVVLTGLPIASAMMARSYQADASTAMRLWWAAMGVAVIGIVVFVIQLSPQDRNIYGPNENTVRQEAGVSDVMWRYSGRCRQPENDDQQEACNEFLSAMQATQNSPISAEWSPKKLLSVASTMPDGPYRQTGVLCLLLLAIIAAGYCGRFYILGTSESYRLGAGEASALPSGISPQPAVPLNESLYSPDDIFSSWAASRLRVTGLKDDNVISSNAYEDYAETCRMNGLPAMSLNAFGKLMTARAANSDGRMAKDKTKGGKMVYSGVKLNIDGQANGAGSFHG